MEEKEIHVCEELLYQHGIVKVRRMFNIPSSAKVVIEGIERKEERKPIKVRQDIKPEFNRIYAKSYTIIWNDSFIPDSFIPVRFVVLSARAAIKAVDKSYRGLWKANIRKFEVACRFTEEYIAIGSSLKNGAIIVVKEDVMRQRVQLIDLKYDSKKGFHHE